MINNQDHDRLKNRDAGDVLKEEEVEADLQFPAVNRMQIFMAHMELTVQVQYLKTEVGVIILYKRQNQQCVPLFLDKFNLPSLSMSQSPTFISNLKY